MQQLVHHGATSSNLIANSLCLALLKFEQTGMLMEVVRLGIPPKHNVHATRSSVKYYTCHVDPLGQGVWDYQICEMD